MASESNRHVQNKFHSNPEDNAMLGIRSGTYVSTILFALILGLTLTPKACAGEFWIENKTQREIFVAVGYYSPRGTFVRSAYPLPGQENEVEGEEVTEGWFKVKAGTNSRVYRGPRSDIFLRIAHDQRKNALLLPEPWEGNGCKILSCPDGRPVHWDHDGFRVCLGDDSKRWGLRFSEQYASISDGPVGNYEESPLTGASPEEVKCKKDEGFRKILFSGKSSHSLVLTEDQGKISFDLGPRK